jgi:hypothetical protein
MVFCKGKNDAKSTIFYGSISNAKPMNIISLIGFGIGSLPFTYLGVLIFRGKPKVVHLLPIADKIKTKLSIWKASSLYIHLPMASFSVERLGKTD